MEIDSEMFHGNVNDRRDEFLARLNIIEQQSLIRMVET
jgi:hypothetical protein